MKTVTYKICLRIGHYLNEAGEYLYSKCILKYRAYSEIKEMAGCGENAKGPFQKV